MHFADLTDRLRGAREETRRAAEAQVALAGGGQTASAALVRDRELRSPIAGEIARRLIEEGEVVTPAIPLFQVVDIDHPWVRLSVRESRLPRFAKGRRIAGSIPALGLDDVAFRVTEVGALGEFATTRATRQSSGYDERTFEVKLSPARPIEGLRPGMSVLFDPGS